MTDHYFIFNIAGGTGKNIMATATVEAIKKAHPKSKIIVTSPWTIVWENNPHIEKCISLDQAPNFYTEYIKDKNCTILRLDPYNTQDFLRREKSLIEIWCDLSGVPYGGEIPKLYFTKTEIEIIEKKIFSRHLHTSSSPTNAQEFAEKAKPIFMIQPSGGAFTQPYPISWARDLPMVTIEKIVKAMNERGYRTIHLRRDNQLPVTGAEWINFTLREAMAAVQFSNKRLFVDSFGAHAAAAWRKPSIVTWVVNSPKVFGYEMHTNILPDASEVYRHRMTAYLEPYDIMGQWHEHPYETDNIFSAEKILDLLK